MEITQIISMLCNCSCNYCMNGKNSTHTLPTNEVTLEQLISFYSHINEPLVFKITGGEPLHPLTVDKTMGLAKYLIMNHDIQSVQINTNGYFDIPEYLLQHKKVRFQFSLDGPKEYQNKITGVDIYDRILSNIDKVVKIKNNSHIMSVLTEDNFNHIWTIKCIAKEHNIPVKFQYVAPVGGAIKLNTIYAKNRINEINSRYPGNCRGFVDKCDTDHNYLKFAVDVYGNIIKCPYLQKYTSELNIFNTKPTEKVKIATTINKTLNGRTCCKPE